MSREIEVSADNRDTREPELSLQSYILGSASDLQILVDVSDFIHSKKALVGVFDFLGFKDMMSSQDLLGLSTNLLYTSGDLNRIHNKI